ncbi:MAG: hypothetical protein HFH88_10290 [Lachnospiraceae bacterium]|jgi:hypothetical protein|nr:hypothetical protein [Lachnospiraceae bacterium]
MEQPNTKVEHMAHELAYGKFLHHLIVDYKDVKLSDGQLYALYQQCCNLDDFVEIINTGSAEYLP